MITTVAEVSRAKKLSCSKCRKQYDIDNIYHLSSCCQHPLIVEYAAQEPLSKKVLPERSANMWRYQEMLPLKSQVNRVTLGEGMTPILKLDQLGHQHGFSQLWVKDEGQNPTGSFKARGMSVAVSRAKELGITACVVPTAGNAGGAMSAYCRAAGIKATIVMPKITAPVFSTECRMYGANVIMADGLIDQCGTIANEIADATGAFNMATLREPYRLEGKKTMGYEIAEQMNWQLPDVIIYPTGGGTGLIGIWKAFFEMIALGWIAPDQLPRMIVVQSENCSPVVDYINKKPINPSNYTGSIAGGLAVPKVLGMEMIEKVIAESSGLAIGVTEEEILAGLFEFTSVEGLAISPEGAATWAALKKLRKAEIHIDDKVLLLNTGTAYKHMDLFN